MTQSTEFIQLAYLGAEGRLPWETEDETLLVKSLFPPFDPPHGEKCTGRKVIKKLGKEKDSRNVR